LDRSTRYQVTVALFDLIDTSGCHYKVGNAYVDISMKKRTEGMEWKRLTQSTASTPNIKVDWDRSVDASDVQESKLPAASSTITVRH
jgi:hypothetical protein